MNLKNISMNFVSVSKDNIEQMFPPNFYLTFFDFLCIFMDNLINSIFYCE